MVLDSSKVTERTKEITADKVSTKKKIDSLLTVNGTGLKEEKGDSAKNFARSTKKAEENDDFYGRLRDMYNKPLTCCREFRRKSPSKAKEDIKTEKREPQDMQREIDSLKMGVKKFLNNSPEDTTERQRYRPEEKIKYNRNQQEGIECKTAHYDEPNFDLGSIEKELPELRRRLGAIEEEYSDSDENDPENRFPTLENMPENQEELEKVFYKYVDGLGSLVDSMQRKGVFEPGTKESAMNCKYRLEDLKAGMDATEAVTGVRRCNCPDTIVIDGDKADLNDIKMSVKELKNNHNVGSVIVKMKKGDHTVDDSVDSSQKMKDYHGPALLTKHVLETLSCQISKHPCLGNLVFEYVPLSSRVQTLLIPAFANLNSLKLLGTKLKDEGVIKLCQYLWRSKNLVVIDLTDNGITHKGAEKIAKLINKKGFCKVLDPVSCGIERLTLNNNPIGTKGLNFLLQTLQTDLFMKAIDLRECDIETTAADVLDMVASNTDLNVLDLRGNMVDRMDIIIKNILRNCPLEHTKYKWDDEEEIKKYDKLRHSAHV